MGGGGSSVVFAEMLLVSKLTHSRTGNGFYCGKFAGQQLRKCVCDPVGRLRYGLRTECALRRYYAAKLPSAHY